MHILNQGFKSFSLYSVSDPVTPKKIFIRTPSFKLLHVTENMQSVLGCKFNFNYLSTIKRNQIRIQIRDPDLATQNTNPDRNPFLNPQQKCSTFNHWIPAHDGIPSVTVPDVLALRFAQCV